MTRRAFLQLVGAVAGAGGVYRAMGAMGLSTTAPTTSGSSATMRALELTGPANGTRVIILGAGLSGMCAAYELRKAGYSCTILEARERPGGRCHTIRRACVQREIDGVEQSCTFDEGLYFNPGPTRIPQDHLTLDYCRELGVAVEPFINVNDAAYVVGNGNKPIRMRDAGAALRAITDAGDIIAKAANPAALEHPITRAEAIELLRMSRFWGGEDTRQLVMFQIVGGTDQLAHAFASRLGENVIQYAAVVNQIGQNERGVEIHYTDKLGQRQRASADYCICTIPPPVLKDVKANFSPATAQAIAGVTYFTAAKVGLQFKRRFWEEDEHIFGGVTWTNSGITQIFYPSCGFLGPKGVVVGCYNYGDEATRLGAMPPTQRIERVVELGSAIHPQYRQEFECGFSCAWHRIPYSLGAWAGEGAETARRTLRDPDGRTHFAGDYLSNMSGWMAGALQTGRDAAVAIHRRVHA